MTRAFPYRRPPADVVGAAPWTLVAGDTVSTLPDALEDWDYNTHLHLRRSVRVDAKRARSAAGLPADTHLRLSVRWTVSGSLLRGSAARLDVGAGDDENLDVRIDLPGSELGGVLTLETLLILADEVPATSDGARTATRRGSVLWGDSHAVRLQGGAAMFPVVVADLASLGHRADAAWYLEVSGDVDSQVMGSLLLIVNSRNDTLRDAVQAPSSAQSEVVLSALRSGVATGLVEHALAVEEFDPAVEYAAGTFGSVLAGLIAQLGLTAEWPSLHGMRAAEPALFAELMQHATRLWAMPQ